MNPDTRLAVFTICSNNYLPFAHVLFQSVRDHHPEADLFLCLADRKADPGAYSPEWTVIEAQTLPIPDFPAFAFRYDIMEFNTALKPFMFLHLLEHHRFDAVIYLDPDIQLFAPLAPVLDALQDGASFVFTPHLCAPHLSALCPDRQEPNDITILRAGAYNLGFLGVSRTRKTLELLNWWARRLRYQCVNAQARGLFVDQKFMDLVPGFDPTAAICHDTTLNVAYWNLPQRHLAHTGQGWTVDGAPLTFFHFSGFNPHDPSRLSKHDPRFVAPLPDPLHELTRQYARRLLAHGYGAAPSLPYAYARFASGTPIPPLVREMFRDWHPFWESDPFHTYEAFLHQPWPGASRAVLNHVVTNLMRFLHQTTPRLARLDLTDPQAVGILVHWFVNDAAEELHLDPALIEPAATRLGQDRRPPTLIPRRDPTNEIDITLTAPLHTASEASQCGQTTFQALLATGLAVDMRDARAPSHFGNAPVQIICLDASQLPAALPAWAAQAPPDALRILIPFSDLAKFPAAAFPCLDLVHEIWVPTRSLQLALAGRTTRPVIHMPLAAKLADRLHTLGLPRS